MIAKLSRTGLSPNEAAIAGSEVASTVEIQVLHEQGAGDDQRDEGGGRQAVALGSVRVQPAGANVRSASRG